ncbi:MAG: DUF6273 domain-containing protein [Ignavibacteriales bacterium]
MKYFLVIIGISFLLTGCAPRGEKLVEKELNIPIQTDNKNEGLYLEIDRYVYRGKNPNNYIKFNDQLLRIISFENDGTIKIKAPNINLNEDIPFDINNNGDWRNSSLREYLNDIYYNSLSKKSKKLIISHDWEMGRITNEVYEKVIAGKFELLKENEITRKVKNYIGLLTLSDYSSSLLDRTCLINNKGCPDNYIYGDGISWTLNSQTDKTNWIINYATGFATIEGTNQTNFYIEPVFYIKYGLKIKGKGTINNPFAIE